MKNDNFFLKSIELTTHVHSTEDLDKVKHAVLFLLPENLRSKIELKVNKVTGHWNNPISILQAKITAADDLKQIIDYLANSLNDREKQILKEGLERRIEKSHLYLRFDKQAAFNKCLQINDEDDVIRLKITVAIYPSSTPERMKLICESLLIK